MDVKKINEIKINVQYNKQAINFTFNKLDSVGSLSKKIHKMFYPLPNTATIYFGELLIQKEDEKTIESIVKNSRSILLIVYGADKQKKTISRKETNITNNSKRDKNKINSNKDDNTTKHNIINCNCEDNAIEVYCRECDEYLCVSCMNNKECKNHKYISVTVDNLENGVKNYIRSIQQDVLDFNQLFGQELNKANFDNFKDSIKVIDEIKESINNRMEEFNNKTKIMITNFENKYSNIENIKIIADLETYLMELNNSFETNPIEDFKSASSYFSDIHIKEIEFDIYTRDACNFNNSLDIIRKINDLYTEIDQNIEATILKYKILNQKPTENNFKRDKERLLSIRKEKKKKIVNLFKGGFKNLINKTIENIQDGPKKEVKEVPIIKISNENVKEELELPILKRDRSDFKVYMKKKLVFDNVSTKNTERYDFTDRIILASKSQLNSPRLEPKNDIAAKLKLNNSKIDTKKYELFLNKIKQEKNPGKMFIDPTEQLKIRSHRKSVFEY